MIKFVVSNKKLLLAINKIPLVKHFFVYDFSTLNTITDEDFYNLVFSHIVVSNGLTKTTRSGRFKDLDEITLNIFRQTENTRFHDIGVSNGITSLELYNKVDQINPPAFFCISDKYAKIYYKGGAIKKFYDADGNLMSVNFIFLHFSPRIGKAFFLSRWLFGVYKKTTHLQTSWFKEILLLAPAVYKKILEKKIELLDFDVFESKAENPFTFLRCMNVLMPAYFSTDRIREATDNLRENLVEGGYLLLGRTDANNINHATFYTKENDQLKAIKNVSNGFDFNNPA